LSQLSVKLSIICGKFRDICMKIECAIFRPTASLCSQNFVYKTFVRYLFFKTNKILRISITLEFMGVELLLFLIHLQQFLLCFPPKLRWHQKPWKLRSIQASLGKICLVWLPYVHVQQTVNPPPAVVFYEKLFGRRYTVANQFHG